MFSAIRARAPLAPRTSTRSFSLLKADEGSLGTSLYHKGSLALVALTPLAFGLSPSPYVLPLDVALGVLLPLHAHVGLNYVITDYAPKVSKNLAMPLRVALLVVTGGTVLGLAKLNVVGPGLTHTIKGLWRGEKKEEGKK